MANDLERIAARALDAFLSDEPSSSERRPERARHRLSTGSALALGVGLGVAARAAYDRVRAVDLTRLAGSLERKLSG